MSKKQTLGFVMFRFLEQLSELFFFCKLPHRFCCSDSISFPFQDGHLLLGVIS